MTTVELHIKADEGGRPWLYVFTEEGNAARCPLSDAAATDPERLGAAVDILIAQVV